MSLLSFIFYLPLQFLFIPLALLGSIYVGYRQIVVSKKPGISQVSRTLYFDSVIERVIDDVEQFVFMGAGYDTRAYGLLLDKDVTIFEMDQVSVQQHKKQGLAAAGIACEHVHFVPVDFSQDDAFVQLTRAGFDRTKKHCFFGKA